MDVKRAKPEKVWTVEEFRNKLAGLITPPGIPLPHRKETTTPTEIAENEGTVLRNYLTAAQQMRSADAVAITALIEARDKGLYDTVRSYQQVWADLRIQTLLTYYDSMSDLTKKRIHQALSENKNWRRHILVHASEGQVTHIVTAITKAVMEKDLTPTFVASEKSRLQALISTVPPLIPPDPPVAPVSEVSGAEEEELSHSKGRSKEETATSGGTVQSTGSPEPRGTPQQAASMDTSVLHQGSEIQDDEDELIELVKVNATITDETDQKVEEEEQEDLGEWIPNEKD